MATSSCARCGGKQFELVDAPPMNTDFAVVFIQCATCGGVIGMAEGRHVGTALTGVQTAIENVRQVLENVQAAVDRVVRKADA